MSDVLLRLDRVTMQFGGLKAVSDLDLEVTAGSLFGLIGPNGAGKTTVFNLITGVYTPTGGSITFEQHPIHGLRPSAIARRGITRTFQNIRLFGQLTVWQNLWVAQNSGEQRDAESFVTRWLGGARRARGEIDRGVDDGVLGGASATGDDSLAGLPDARAIG